MAQEKSHIARIGVTGGIGSGKSVVCAIFERLGVLVLYADEIAREISVSNHRVKQAMISLFGSKSYRSDGALNRPYVAARVFSNKSLQKKLNAIVHPVVEKELDARIQKLNHRHSPFVLVEAALIFEAGFDKGLDAVIVVDAEEDVRVRRVVERDGVEEKEVLGRMNAQWSQRRKLQQADYIIGNNGPLNDLESQVHFLYHILSQLYQ